jgi:mannose-6-phosphate isomerase-like protein (cupin superfamily)
VSVVIGRGTLALAGEEVAVTPHDHFGIPAGLPATLRTDGGDPLVLLDAMIEPGNCAEWV